jgi:hypothetical protein
LTDQHATGARTGTRAALAYGRLGGGVAVEDVVREAFAHDTVPWTDGCGR